MKEFIFKKARPIWEKGKSDEMNYNLIFSAEFPCGGDTCISVAASSKYCLYVNGKFVAEGPARAAHGFHRVDCIDISCFAVGKRNIAELYVSGYNVANYYRIKQPSFLCAEITLSGRVAAATGESSFTAVYDTGRIRKIVRLSGQRTFAEAYDIGAALGAPVETEICESKRFIERGVPYPLYEKCSAESIVLEGTVEWLDEAVKPNRQHYVTGKNGSACFSQEPDMLINTDEADKGVYTAVSVTKKSSENFVLDANSYAIVELPSERTGFITAELLSNKNAEFIAVFDEILSDGDVSTKRTPGIQNAVIWNMPEGSHSLTAREPYSMKYIKLINKSQGKITVKKIGVTELKYPLTAKPLNSGNKTLDLIYDSAVETFRQNTLDIYMDCPSRERAGWLCDSFFTARVEKILTGKSAVEKNFLENFIAADSFKGLPDGMLPMCYPADFRPDWFIPNWAMWFVLQLEEYKARTNDICLIEKARDKVFRLLEYFKAFENPDGLLQKLKSWVFVEWSESNSFVQDVNYPTNMLYARMLRSVGALYDPKYTEKAEKIEAVIRKQSYFDGFFHDHAVLRQDETLEVIRGDISETCQYYAFFMGTASKETYPALWNTLLNDFGPDRAKKGLYKNIHPSNAFIGYFLRLEILSDANETEKVLSDIEGFFGYMAETTGTLWENAKPEASCNHGFASHVIVWLDKIFSKE